MSTQPAPETEADGHLGLFAQLQSLDTRFWIVNVMEMFERLAYYGVRAVLSIYMVLALEAGGPEFDHVQKGNIYAAWAFVQSMLPVFTGGFADRYGHKNTIAVAILMKIVGYLMMAFFKDYGLFFAGCMMLAAGTAVFKPGVQGTLAATLKASNASVGWGVFYQLVNVGGFLGPVLAGYLRLMDWKYVFIACAVIVSINFLWLPFYRDSSQELAHSDAQQAQGWSSLSRAVSRRTIGIWLAIWSVAFAASVRSAYLAIAEVGWTTEALLGTSALLTVITGTFVAALGAYLARKSDLDEGRTDPGAVFLCSVAGMFQHRVIWFCLVFAGFWLMFNQVFDLLPNVIEDWVDSSGLIAAVGRALSTPTVPTILAVLLGLLAGGVVAVTILLAMRPDHRPVEDVTVPAYVVVGLALIGALLFPWQVLVDPLVGETLAGFGARVVDAGWPTLGAMLPGLVRIGAVATVALILTVGVRALRVQAHVLALGAGVVTALCGMWAMRASFLASSAELVRLAAEGHQVNPEWMVNLNPGLIVFTMIGFAYLSSFVRPLTSIIVGMAIAIVGSVVAGTATVGWVCLAGILIFSIGEMLSSPKKMEYLASLSRKGQEALFMGYANVPLAIGWVAGSILAGSAYEERGDKVNLAKKHLVEALGYDPSTVEALDKTAVLPTLAEELGLTQMEVQRFLFETYHPETLWYTIALVGVASVVGMVIYDRVIRMVDARKPG